MTKLTVITPPAEEPVTLAVAKEYLRIGHDGEDDLVMRLIQSARARIEQEAAFALVAQVLKVNWTSWPASLAGRGVLLPRRPALSLVSVQTVGADEGVTDHTDRFRLECGRLCLRPWSLAPAIETGGWIEIVYEAGFGSVDDVPDDLKEAVLRLVAASYRARAATGSSSNAETGLPIEVQSILVARREVRL